jgi:hypothetical protein
MSQFQAKWYKEMVEAEKRGKTQVRIHEVPNDFYIKSRQRSNVVFPRGLGGASGLAALTPTLIKGSLDTYSAKFARLIRKLRRGHLAFVYTAFVEYGGIRALTKVLQTYGYQDMEVAGPGRRRYAIWSGQQTLRTKDTIRATFNDPSNDDGSKIQVVIGSPAIREGVSLLRVRQVHVLEAYWNFSRLAQIFGRAVRYCSHKSLPRADRHVDIYIYAAVVGARVPRVHFGDPINTIGVDKSVDLYMLDMASRKAATTAPIITALMDAAVDRPLNQTE